MPLKQQPGFNCPARTGSNNMAQILKESETETPTGEHVGGDGSAASVHGNVDERALLMKMDLQFIPWLSFLYFLSFLDRTSIGNARVSCNRSI